MKTKGLYNKKIVIVAIFIVSILFVSARSASVSEFLDTSYVIGKTSNGMSYYIKPNPEGKKRVEIRLIVKAGSVLEKDNQKGLAHFVEHMGFNGSKKYPKNEVVEMFQKNEVRFGADLNAYTTYDSTVFQISYASDKTKLLDIALDVVKEWAHNLTYDLEEIEAEKGVVQEEVRTASQPQHKAFLDMHKFLLAGSAYENRSPGGSLDVIENAPREVIKNFYDTWYKPNMMAIAVVGDINAKSVEKKILEIMTHTDTSVDAPIYGLPLEDGTEPMVKIFNGGESAYLLTQIVYRRPDFNYDTVQGVYDDVLTELMHNAINIRLRNITDNSLFTSRASVTQKPWHKTFQKMIVIQPKEGYVKESFQEIVTEIERLKRYGFSQEEWEQSKKEYLNFIDTDFVKNNNRVFLGSIRNNFLYGTPIFDLEKIINVIKGNDITLKEVNEELKKFGNPQYNFSQARIAFVTTGRKEDNVPSEQEAKDIFIGIKSAQLEPYKKVRAVVDSLVDSKTISAGSIESEVYDKQNDTYVFTLSNGVKVFFKNTKYTDLSINAFAPNFLWSRREDKSQQYNITLKYLPTGSLKINNYSWLDVQRFFQRNSIGMRPSFGSRYFSIYGSVNEKDTVEKLFQSIYAYFKSVSFDEERKEFYLSSVRDQISSSLRSDSGKRYSRFERAMYPTNKFLKEMELSDLSKIDFNIINDVYKQMTNDISAYTFVMAGELDIESVRKMLETYLASIPVREKALDRQPYSLGLTQNDSTKIVFSGGKAQDIVNMTWVNELDIQKSLHNFVLTNFISSVLSIKMLDEIREKNSDVYGINVAYLTRFIPITMGRLHVSFRTEPKKTTRVITTVNEIIDEFINQKIDSDVIARAKSEYNAYFTDILNNNASITRIIENLVQIGTLSDTDIINFKNILLDEMKSVTYKEAAEYLKQFFDTARYVELIQKPIE